MIKNLLLELRKVSYPAFIFWFFIAVYASLFLINPQLGPTDDFHFLRTIQSGKPLVQFGKNFPYFDPIALGRFTPFVSTEYNFALLPPFSSSPFWYFLLHAVQFVIFVILFVKLLKKVTSSAAVTYWTTAVFLFLPSFTIPWFRLQLPERNVLMLFTILLLASSAFYDKRKLWAGATGIVAALLGIFLKETAFLGVGVFAFFHLILSFKNKEANKKTAAFDSALILGSFTYIAVYYFLVYRHTSFLYLAPSHSLIETVKNVLNYAFFSDPLIVLIVMPFTLWRIYKIFFKKVAPEPLFDSMLMGASAYAASFFALNIYGPYYFLPAYAFAVPALAYFYSKTTVRIAPLFLKISLVATAFLFIFNVIPSGIHHLTYNKYLPANFNKTIDFLIADIKTRLEKNPADKPSIFLAGVDRKNGRGIYFVFAEYLRFKGLDSEKFDLKSDIATADGFPVSKIVPPFTVFKPGPALTAKTGDYIVVNPYRTKNVDFQQLNSDYRLVFKTESRLAFPDVNLKTLVKYYLLKNLPQGSAGVMVSENLLNQPDYLVFVKK